MFNLLKNKIFSYSVIKNITLIYIIFFSIYLIVGSVIRPTAPIGESDDYMLPTVAWEVNFSPFITQKVIEKAKEEFPEHANSFNLENLPKDKNGNHTGYYSSTYSLFILPIKEIFSFLSLPQASAFTFGNALIYASSLFIIFFKFKSNEIEKLITTMFISLNPLIFYIHWPSAEVFIASLIIISMVFLLNKSYYLSAFFISLAGSVNITSIVVGIPIVLLYFYDKYLNTEKSSFKNKLKKTLLSNFNRTFILGVCFIPAFIPIVFNLINYGSIVKMQGASTVGNLFGRALAYLLDLNLGLLPYFNITFLCFIILLIIGLYKKTFLTLSLCIGFFGNILAYSLMFHINSGMSVIARYNSWISSLIVFFSILLVRQLGKKFIINSVYLCFFIGTVLSGIIVYKCGNIYGEKYNFIYFQPIARYVLNNYPALYNPYPYTFVSRVDHVDGGYYYKQPVIYYDDNNQVRKILITPDTANNVIEMLKGNDSATDYLKIEVEKLKSKKGFCYINIPKGYALYNAKNIVSEINTTIYLGTDNERFLKDKYIFEGLHLPESSFTWTKDKFNIRILPKKNEDINITINMAFFKPTQSVDVYCDKDQITTLVPNKSNVYNFIVPKKYITSGSFNELKFYVNGANSPKNIGMNADERILGAAISSISFEYKE